MKFGRKRKSSSCTWSRWDLRTNKWFTSKTFNTTFSKQNHRSRPTPEEVWEEVRGHGALNISLNKERNDGKQKHRSCWEELFLIFHCRLEERRKKLEKGGWLRRKKTRTRGTSWTDEFSASDTQSDCAVLIGVGRSFQFWVRREDRAANRWRKVKFYKLLRARSESRQVQEGVSSFSCQLWFSTEEQSVSSLTLFWIV